MEEMFIERRIIKRGNVKIKLTLEEIKKASEIYSEYIKEKSEVSKNNNYISKKYKKKE